MNYGLPTTVEVGGKTREIRTDFRAILDILTALNDPDLSDSEKSEVMIGIFYVDEIQPDEYEEAMERCAWFMNMGDVPEKTKHEPKLMDWEQDFNYIIAPINRVAGRDVRADSYMHWWTFMAFYNEIGDCLFAQIVSIRDKRARGKKLDKSDKEFYRRNRDIIELKNKYTQAEEEILEGWI